MGHSLSFAERRRALALKVVRLDRLESRSTVTPLGATALGFGVFTTVAQAGFMHASRGGVTP